MLLLVVSMLAFGAMNLLGDPLFNILGPTAGDVDNPESLAKIEAVKEEYNLDDPLPVRYVLWLGAFVQGDFGVQFSEDGQPPVRDLIVERIPRTLSLLVMAQTMAVVMSVPWALFAASRANSKTDKVSTVGAFWLISVPNYALAILISYLLAIRFDFFPLVYEAGDPLPSRFHQLVLPAFALALPAAAVYQRLLRTDLITHAAGGLHPDGAGQGSVAPFGAPQTRTAALAVLVRHGVRAHDRRARSVERSSSRTSSSSPVSVGPCTKPCSARTSRSYWRS